MKTVKKKRNGLVGGVFVTTLCLSVFMMMLGISNAINEISHTLIKEDAESILAEAGMKNEDKVSLSVAYYDKDDKGYAGILEMRYRTSGAEFSFYKDEFYPLGKELGKDLFKMDLALPFMVIANGKEYFEIEADDETLVYVGDELVLEMKGASEARSGRFKIGKSGEVYASVGEEDFTYSGVNVTKGEGELVKVLHVDKDAMNGSSFNLITRGMNLTVNNTQVATKKSSKMEIAYNPMDETYVPPLGETKVFDRDGSMGLTVLIIIEGAAVLVLTVFIVLGVKYVVREKIK